MLIRLHRVMQNQMRKAGGRNGKHIICGLLRQQLMGSAGFSWEAKAYMYNNNTWPNIGPITMNWDESKWDRILSMSRRFLVGFGGPRVSNWVFLGVVLWGGSCLLLFHLNVDDSSRSAMVGRWRKARIAIMVVLLLFWRYHLGGFCNHCKRGGLFRGRLLCNAREKVVHFFWLQFFLDVVELVRRVLRLGGHRHELEIIVLIWGTCPQPDDLQSDRILLNFGLWAGPIVLFDILHLPWYW